MKVFESDKISSNSSTGKASTNTSKIQNNKKRIEFIYSKHKELFKKLEDA